MKFRPGVVPQWPSSRGLICSSDRGFLQQRVGVKINLADGQIVRRPPISVDERRLLVRQRLGRPFLFQQRLHHVILPQPVVGPGRVAAEHQFLDDAK